MCDQEECEWPETLVLECEWCPRTLEIDPHWEAPKDENGPWSPLTEEARDRKDGGGWICSYCADVYHRGYSKWKRAVEARQEVVEAAQEAMDVVEDEVGPPNPNSPDEIERKFARLRDALKQVED